jgi:hypothetical protein
MVNRNPRANFRFNWPYARSPDILTAQPRRCFERVQDSQPVMSQWSKDATAI